jgi:hypothetical protein
MIRALVIVAYLAVALSIAVLLGRVFRPRSFRSWSRTLAMAILWLPVLIGLAIVTRPRK